MPMPPSSFRLPFWLWSVRIVQARFERGGGHGGAHSAAATDPNTPPSPGALSVRPQTQDMADEHTFSEASPAVVPTISCGVIDSSRSVAQRRSPCPLCPLAKLRLATFVQTHDAVRRRTPPDPHECRSYDASREQFLRRCGAGVRIFGPSLFAKKDADKNILSRPCIQALWLRCAIAPGLLLVRKLPP